MQRVGLGTAAWTSAAAVVGGLAVFAATGRFGYGWVVVALVLVAAGMRVVGVVAGTEVLRGLPEDRTSIGAALVDTSSELATGVGIALSGTVLAALVPGSIAATVHGAVQVHAVLGGIGVAGGGLALVAAALVLVGIVRARGAVHS